MTSVIAERNLFVNTSTVVEGSGRDVTISLPQGYATCNANQQMKLTLTSFLMEKKFYNINYTNNKMYLSAYDSTAGADWLVVGRLCTFSEGNYRAFGGRQLQQDATIVAPVYWYDPKGMGYAIKRSLEEALGFRWNLATGQYDQITPDATSTAFYRYSGASTHQVEDLVVVEFDSVKSAYSFTIKPDPTTMEINVVGASSPLAPFPATTTSIELGLFSFEIPNYRRIANNVVDAILGNNVDVANVFVDTHELLGGCSVEDNTTTENSKAAYDTLRQMYIVDNSIAGTWNFQGQFQASLRTIEAVYVRTNLSSSNFQTSSFDSGGNLYPYVISSTILAKIPSDNPIAVYTNEYFPAATAANAKTFQPVLYAYNDYVIPWEYISFVDQGGDTWGAMLNTNHVSQIRMFLTDDKGRLLPWQSAGQRACNEMYFTATLKIKVME